MHVAILDTHYMSLATYCMASWKLLTYKFLMMMLFFTCIGSFTNNFGYYAFKDRSNICENLKIFVSKNFHMVAILPSVIHYI